MKREKILKIVLSLLVIILVVWILIGLVVVTIISKNSRVVFHKSKLSDLQKDLDFTLVFPESNYRFKVGVNALNFMGVFVYEKDDKGFVVLESQVVTFEENGDSVVKECDEFNLLVVGDVGKKELNSVANSIC